MAAGRNSAACRASPVTRPGAEALRKAMQFAADRGIEVLTIYAFSSENWRRSDEEIADLTGLMRFYLERELDDLTERGRSAEADRRCLGVWPRPRVAPGEGG